MEQTTRFTLTSLWTGALPVVRLTTVVWTLLLLLWSVLLPIFSAPDEPQHIDLALTAIRYTPFEWVAPEAAFMGVVTREAQERYGYYLPSPDPQSAAAEVRRGGRPAEEALPRDARPSYAELFLQDGHPGTRFNQMAQHPPLYYRAVSWAIQVVPDWQDMSFDRLVAIMRILSVLVVAPLPLILAAIAGVLNGRESFIVGAGLSVFLVPQLAHIGSVVSNDAPLITFSALLTLLVARVLRGDLSASTANWIGGVLLAALLTKGFALFLPLGVLAAYLGAVRGHAEQRALAFSRLARSGAIAALALGWYGENYFRFGSLQPSVGEPPRAVVQGQLADFLPRVLDVQMRTFWGRFGWAEIGFDVWHVAVLSVIALLLVSLGSYRRSGFAVAAMVLPGSLITLITLVRSYSYFDVEGNIRAVQGRYFYISVAGLLVLMVAGLQRALPARLARWTWVSVLGVGALLHLISWQVTLRYFWTVPPDRSLVDAVTTMLVWQAWPPRLIQFVGLAFVVSCLMLLRALVRQSSTLDGGLGGPRAARASSAPLLERGAQPDHNGSDHEDAVAT